MKKNFHFVVHAINIYVFYANIIMIKIIKLLMMMIKILFAENTKNYSLNIVKHVKKIYVFYVKKKNIVLMK